MRKSEGEFVKDLSPGPIEAKFAIYETEVKLTKNNKKYVRFRLGDKTGVLTALYFTDNESEVDEIINRYHSGEIVRIKGIVEEYENRLNIKIGPLTNNSIMPCDETGYEISDFRAVTKRDKEEMLRKIKEGIEHLENPYLRKLCEFFFKNNKFLEKFKEIPGAQSKHHNYEGGLLEHIYEMIRLWDVVCEFHKELDRELLLCGIIFHDIGKLKSYAFKGASIERTTEEELIGHIVLGERMVRDAMDKIEGFPEELKSKISHLILSHHGEIREGYGSAISPKLVEAYILYYLDYADSQINLVMQRYGGLERE